MIRCGVSSSATALSLPRIATRAPRRCARVAYGESLTLVNVRMLSVRVPLQRVIEHVHVRLGGEVPPS